jgi:hypothetical protein
MQRTSCVVIFIGCATTAPDGSSPRGFGRMHASDHRLRKSCRVITFSFSFQNLWVADISDDDRCLESNYLTVANFD